MLNDNNFFSGGAVGGFYDHPIEQSLRFNDNDSAYLSWTPASAGNRKTWTWSGWFKRGNLDVAYNNLLTSYNAAPGTTGYFVVRHHSADSKLHILINRSPFTELRTQAVFRDPSAWYHIVCTADTTNATSTDRIRLYVNGERQTLDIVSGGYPAQNEDMGFNYNHLHWIGQYNNGQFYDGYMSELHFIDGTALDASSFGETKSGVWIPKAYSGSYGTNGFYLPFNEAGDFGKDNSRNVHDIFADSSAVATYLLNGDATDEGGNYNGTANGIDWVDGIVDDAAKTNSTADYITANFTMSSSGFSYAFWAKSTGAWTNNRNIYALGTNQLLYSSTVGWRYYTNTWNNLGFILPTDEWFHFCATHDGITTKIYVNGALTNTLTPTYGSLSGTKYLVGSSGYTHENVWWDQWRIFNRALTATEVQTLAGGYALDASSVNTNDFEAHNLNPNDVVLDSPTNNFCTLNPLIAGGTFSEGNLKFIANNSRPDAGISTIGVSSGKYYWEVEANSIGADGCSIGILEDSSLSYAQQANTIRNTADAHLYEETANYRTNGTSSSYGATYTSGDVIGVALDLDAGNLTFYKNGVSQGVAASGLSGTFYPAVTDASSTGGVTVITNFGQDSSFAGNKTAQGNTDDNGYGDFYYAPPTGYLALCTANLEVPDAMNPALDNSPQDYFNTVLYSGNSSTQSITGVGFQPDFLWIKHRNGTADHVLQDAVRGSTNQLYTNLTSAEVDDTDAVQSFDADGFSLDADITVNYSSYNFVAWNWKANGSGVSNTDGSITSTVSANTDAGFSIVSYTGTGSAATVGHGLGVKPEMVILKNRSGVYDWPTWHQNLPNPTTQHFWLNATNAAQIVGSFNSTQPTSSVFSIGTTSEANNSGHNFIAYCFHSVEGFSKAFSYTGNGSTDGSFVYCGFKPAFVMVKNASATGDWFIYDTDRNTYNVNDSRLKPNRSDAEGTGGSYGPDILSNGFKMRTSFGELNGSGNTIIGIAFAETPFRYATAR